MELNHSTFPLPEIWSLSSWPHEVRIAVFNIYAINNIYSKQNKHENFLWDHSRRTAIHVLPTCGKMVYQCERSSESRTVVVSNCSISLRPFHFFGFLVILGILTSQAAVYDHVARILLPLTNCFMYLLLYWTWYIHSFASRIWLFHSFVLCLHLFLIFHLFFQLFSFFCAIQHGFHGTISTLVNVYVYAVHCCLFLALFCYILLIL